MSKLIDINKLLTLKNYSVKYDITKRKIYRYIDSNIIDHVLIDGIPFVYDKPYEELKTDHRYKNASSNVKIVTIDNKNNDKILTKQDNYTDNQEVSNVKIVTKPNDKILTKQEEKLLNTPDVKLSGKQLLEKGRIKKKLSHTST